MSVLKHGRMGKSIKGVAGMGIIEDSPLCINTVLDDVVRIYPSRI